MFGALVGLIVLGYSFLGLSAWLNPVVTRKAVEATRAKAERAILHDWSGQAPKPSHRSRR